MASHKDFMRAAVALAGRSGRAVAILVKPDGSAAQAKVGAHSNVVPHSAAAALLHRETDDLNGWNLYLSYRPTEICLGLAWRAKVNKVCYISGIAEMIEVDPNVPIDSPPGYRDLKVVLTNLEPLKKPDQAAAFLSGLDGGALLRVAPVELRPLNQALGATLAKGLTARRPVVVAPGPDVHEVFMRLVFALVRWGWNDDVAKEARAGADQPRPFGNNIGGILVSQSNQILAWGLNMKKVNPTFHAETMMIQYYLERTRQDNLPEGCRLYTSLECCNMCAGHVATLGKGTQVFYGQKDTNIAPTALSRRVNGCRQAPAPNAHVGWLDRAQASRHGPTQTIDFLFDKDNAPARRTERIFEAGAHLHPIRFGSDAADTASKRGPGFVKQIAAGAVSPALAVATEAEKFLNDLQREGILVGVGRG